MQSDIEPLLISMTVTQILSFVLSKFENLLAQDLMNSRRNA